MGYPEHLGKGIEPGGKQRPPAEAGWLQVHHATPTHSSGLGRGQGRALMARRMTAFTSYHDETTVTTGLVSVPPMRPRGTSPPLSLCRTLTEAYCRSMVSKMRFILLDIWMISPLIRHSCRQGTQHVQHSRQRSIPALGGTLKTHTEYCHGNHVSGLKLTLVQRFHGNGKYITLSGDVLVIYPHQGLLHTYT